MNFIQILILGLVQGAAELLPVSSSAHVIVAEKLMGLDPSSPEMTFLLVMLHTGTMFAVIAYFWNSWLDHYCSDAAHLESSVKTIVAATVATVIVGLALQWIIEKIFMHGQPKAEIEDLFSNLPLIGGALLAAGVLILFSGTIEERRPGQSNLDVIGSVVIGAVQGLCLPFRGFSRSGGTISAGLLLGVRRRQIEEFSFALAVVLTPFVVVKELWRLLKAHPEMAHGPELMKLLSPGFFGMACSFVAGYVALKLLSSLLEGGHWKYFGYYCMIASGVVFTLAFAGTNAASAESTVTPTVPPPVLAPAPDTTTNTVTPVPITNAEVTPVVPVAPAVAPNPTPATPTDPSVTSPPNEPVAPRALPVNPSDMTNAPPVPTATGITAYDGMDGGSRQFPVEGTRIHEKTIIKDNGEVLTPGTINQPVFNVRRVKPQVTVSSGGYTTVAGTLTPESTEATPAHSPAPANVPAH